MATSTTEALADQILFRPALGLRARARSALVWLARSRTSYRQVPAVRDVLHEARNALGAILACAEFLAAHPRLAADLAEATEILRRECLRLDHLAWEILVAGRPGSGPCAG